MTAISTIHDHIAAAREAGTLAAVRRWWKAGRNAWEIEQLTGLDRETVRGILETI